MCEIAIIDPAGVTAEQCTDLAQRLYKRNRHGLGVIAVERGPETLSYDAAKAVNPQWPTVTEWFENHGDVWRIVIHARLATAGGRGFAETHPISTHECGECSIDWVVHNGIVSSHRWQVEDLRKSHDYTTNVDSETIAHTHGDVTNLESAKESHKELTGSLHYILFGDNRIVARMGGRYHLSDRFTSLSCSRRSESGDGNTWALVTPERIETSGPVEREGGTWGTAQHSGSSYVPSKYRVETDGGKGRVWHSLKALWGE